MLLCNSLLKLLLTACHKAGNSRLYLECIRSVVNNEFKLNYSIDIEVTTTLYSMFIYSARARRFSRVNAMLTDPLDDS